MRFLKSCFSSCWDCLEIEPSQECDLCFIRKGRCRQINYFHTIGINPCFRWDYPSGTFRHWHLRTKRPKNARLGRTRSSSKQSRMVNIYKFLRILTGHLFTLKIIWLWWVSDFCCPQRMMQLFGVVQERMAWLSNSWLMLSGKTSTTWLSTRHQAPPMNTLV